MPDTAPHLTRDELLAALDSGWGSFTATVSAWPDATQEQYLQAQGYARLQDLLAHTAGSLDLAGRVIEATQAGRPLPAAEATEADEVNAASIARHQDLFRAEMVAEFEYSVGEMRHLLRDLPDSAFRNPTVYKWLHTSIVAHYAMHNPAVHDDRR